MSDQPILALTHEDAALGGLGALVAVSVLHPRAELLAPAGLSGRVHDLWRAHADQLPSLMLRMAPHLALERAAGGRLYVVGSADAERMAMSGVTLDNFSSVIAIASHPPRSGELPRLALPPAVSCAAALACRIAQGERVPTAMQAGLMLMGIESDTQHFRAVNTTAIDHQGAALCLSWGADRAWMARTGLLQDSVWRAGDLMLRPFVAASADAPIDRVAELLHRHRINALPLFVAASEAAEAPRASAHRQWVGQVSRQEVDAAVRHGLGGAPVRQISARPPGWVRPEQPVSQVRELWGSRWRIQSVSLTETAQTP